jgi:hypothetical protein
MHCDFQVQGKNLAVPETFLYDIILYVSTISRSACCNLLDTFAEVHKVYPLKYYLKIIIE